MERRKFISVLSFLPLVGGAQLSSVNMDKELTNDETRKFWVEQAFKLGFPVLNSLSKGELRLKMPVESAPGHENDRRKVTQLEALARLLSGLAPWFQLDESKLANSEKTQRNTLLDLYYKGIPNAVNPGSRDYLNFSEGNQPLVDTAFLVHAFIKAPILFDKLDSATKQNLIECIITTRKFVPGLSNWLLFSAIREAFLLSTGTEYMMDPIDYALNKHMEWYKGDGVYGDGPSFHWDYYNSFVIHPLLLDLLKIVNQKLGIKSEMLQIEIGRAQRYAEILERFIAPDGSFPPIGRSLSYRAGAFQILSQLALNHQLPPSLPPGQVRSVLTAVMKKTLGPDSTFDTNGWLRIGLYGHQPGIGETYISTGSLYLCSTALLPLGLPPEDKFWSEPFTEWTSRRVWSGKNTGTDHAITT